MSRRRSHTLHAPKPGVPWMLSKQKKKAGLFIRFVIEVEKALPGATGRQKKQWVKRKIDDLINLPPIAEQISDFFIEVGTEIAYAAVQASKLKIVEPSDYDKVKAELKKAKAKIRRVESKLKKRESEYADLYSQWENLKGTTT
jgi:hypothetical protein